MIRYYKKENCWGVILPRGGGVKRFDSEKAAKHFVLACALFEDVWEETPELSDVAGDVEAVEPTVTPAPEDKASYKTSEALIEEDV